MPRRFFEITIGPENINPSNENPNDPARFATRLLGEEISDETSKQPIIAVFEQEGNRGYRPEQVRNELVAALADQFQRAPDSMRYMEHDRDGELLGGTAFREHIFQLDQSGALFKDKDPIPHTREQYERLAASYGPDINPVISNTYNMPSREGMGDVVKEANIPMSERPDSAPQAETSAPQEQTSGEQTNREQTQDAAADNSSHQKIDHDLEPEM